MVLIVELGGFLPLLHPSGGYLTYNSIETLMSLYEVPLDWTGWWSTQHTGFPIPTTVGVIVGLLRSGLCDKSLSIC